MTVRCPRCQTQYRVPDAKLTSVRPVFKCTRCSLVFRPESERARAGSRKRAAGPNLDLPFDEAPSRGRRRRSGDEPTLVSDPAGDDAALLDDEGPTLRDDDDDDLSLLHDNELDPEDIADDDEDARGGDEADEDDAEEEDPGPVIYTSAPPQRTARTRERSADRAPRNRSPLRAVTIGVGLVVAAFVALAGTLRDDPAVALDMLSAVPIVGKTIAQDDLLAWRFDLAEVHGSLDRIKGGRLAYVVEGQAVNTSAQGVRLVEIEGRLIAEGRVRRTQRVYAGNQSRATIRDLSATEVEMLLRLEPNRRFRIPAGGAARFLLVFPDPPPDARDIDCRVVTARTS